MGTGTVYGHGHIIRALVFPSTNLQRGGGGGEGGGRVSGARAGASVSGRRGGAHRRRVLELREDELGLLAQSLQRVEQRRLARRAGGPGDTGGGLGARRRRVENECEVGVAPHRAEEREHVREHEGALGT